MFREEPQYTEVNPGANAELRCVIENIGGECRWQKDGKVSLEPLRDILKTKPRIHQFTNSKCCNKIRNNTPLKRGFKRLFGLYAAFSIGEFVVWFF